MWNSIMFGAALLLGQTDAAPPVPRAQLLPPVGGQPRVVAGPVSSTVYTQQPDGSFAARPGVPRAVPSSRVVYTQQPNGTLVAQPAARPTGARVVFQEPAGEREIGERPGVRPEGPTASDSNAEQPNGEATNGEATNGETKNGEEKNGEEEPWRLFPNEVAGFKVTGFVYGTGVYNATNSGNRYNGPLTMSDQEGAFLNQLYLSFDRAMVKDEFRLGGNLTLLYGNDYNASQSFGWELDDGRLITPETQRWNTGQDYGLAVPQLYAEVGTAQASLVVGHFWTPIGYNVVPAIGNFFNTQPYSFMHGQPFTHWGTMAKYNPNDNWSSYFGVVNGWGALDRQSDSAGFIFGAKYTADENKWFNSTNFYTGQEPENLGTGYGNRTLVNNITYVELTEKFSFLHELNVGVQQNDRLGSSTYYSFSPYLFYKLSDNLKAGFRMDIFRDPGGFVAGVRNGNPNTGPYNGTFWVLNAGLNWSPNGSKNLMIRPEVRYDWFGGQGDPFDAGRRDNMFLAVLGAYYLF